LEGSIMDEAFKVWLTLAICVTVLLALAVVMT
jgi:hypothetical protein